jgi:hypothetical protein
VAVAGIFKFRGNVVFNEIEKRGYMGISGSFSLLLFTIGDFV